jgi:DNA modification methylase
MARKHDVPGQGALFQMEAQKEGLPAKLRERFVIEPFTVLTGLDDMNGARGGWWSGRKRAWINMGIQSELGRGENLIERSDQTRDISHYSRERKMLEEETEAEEFEANNSGLTYGDSPEITEKGLNYYRNKNKAEEEFEANKDELTYGSEHVGDMQHYGGNDKRYKHLAKDEAQRKAYEEATGKPYEVNRGNDAAAITAQHIGEAYGRKGQTGTSIFDPVLCEAAYRWFSPPGGHILDPFAGGSVRGIVAAKLGRSYIGVDLSPYQVEANREQAQRICKGDPYQPVWRVGDSNDLDKICEDDPAVDFVFTCPPYFDLEVYSKDPRDISNAGTYEDFANTYSSIIHQACQQLKDNRFAGIVIGDIRDKKGMYRPFFQHTVAAFEYAGAKLYNTSVLITVTGSLPVRAAKQFTASRKMGRTHQYFLTFVKGDPKKAAEACGDAEYGKAPWE